MGASLGPVLANIIMSELELKITDNLLHSGIIKFYARYVDDTLIMVKSEHIETILTNFNSFHKSLKFMVDKFEHETPHFLDLEMHPDGISIYREDTHTGQFDNFKSFTNWNYKIAWIRSLITRAKVLRLQNKLKQELAKIKLFALYNEWVPKKNCEFCY